MSPMSNAIFFDMDGTLIDSKNDLAIAINHTRRDLGLPEKPIDEIASFVGNGVRRLVAGAIPEAADRVDELVPRHMENYLLHLFDTTALYPSVRSTLAELADRGWGLGIVTNKPSEATRRILEHFGLSRLFGNAVVGGGDCDEMKPSPKPLREAAARMRGHRLSSHDWMVGDNWTDMECAAGAGLKSAFCTFGFGNRRDSRCTVRINRFEELLRYCKAED